ncbi:F0F1 ATP synthase subunit epsilon [Actinomyces urogenitalis]|jgi:F-type H+-transporting ATPase subunit epsilon|uniref:F0F1 ATP synthase subunit epsilon n=1 Tax=Actinomyces urogenitalis TaxID=103621 RepID=UPI00065F8AD0|nr:ATP synthase subunit delta [Actinomyces urogenitalis]MBS6071161.1 hypothetical protein [Actinomyces urogenitalis]MCI7456292.1 hypothetical protein [Actinomyces urogenitalis]MDK8238249.1 hypothetical protein [Actinomyces urogenitalis]MDK8834707.1 hypothetical protein [Actinomyces urogenitalis]MDU0864041.1 hypothetical protein [Actinomyces urogenitalis]
MAGTRELSVEVVSRRGGTAWQGSARSVSVPLIDGELGVLPGRQPVLALLGRGGVRIETVEGESVTLEVAGGFCSVDQDVVTVAADRVDSEITGDDASDIDLVSEHVVATDSENLD